MAKPTTPRSSGPRLLCLLLLVPLAAATQYKVGGSNGWSVPANNASSYNQWAEKNRFKIGDSLVFVYPANNDSVLRVSQEDYYSCNTAHPLARSNDGNTAFIFNQSGLYYFISGVEENCLKNESLVVLVLADQSSRNHPSPAPASSSPPPPPPTSPPPGGEFTSAAPEATSPPPPPPNAASLKVVGIMGSIGAFVGSLALFVL